MATLCAERISMRRSPRRRRKARRSMSRRSFAIALLAATSIGCVQIFNIEEKTYVLADTGPSDDAPVDETDAGSPPCGPTDCGDTCRDANNCGACGNACPDPAGDGLVQCVDGHCIDT